MHNFSQSVLRSSVCRCAVVVAALLLSANTMAQSSVWVATKGEAKVFLGGTVHLLRPSDYPLPAPFENAYTEADELYFETNVTGLSDMSVQAKMMRELTYSDERSLSTVLDKSTYEALSDYLYTTGMPVGMMDKFKPGLLVSTLQIIEFQKLGFTPQGVDAYFNTRAMGDGKNVGELEPIDAQIGYISQMGEGNENEFVRLSLEELDDVATSMDQMLAAWRTGDNESLADLFVNDMKEDHPALYDSLLVERNMAWMPIIESMFQDADTEFVLVGAAHLVGEDGLLNMLESKGYTISSVE